METTKTTEKQHVDLKTLCAQHGFNTQGEVARAMGVTQQSVAYLFNNADAIGMKKLRELCDAIGCTDMREAFTLPDGNTNTLAHRQALAHADAPVSAPAATGAPTQEKPVSDAYELPFGNDANNAPRATENAPQTTILQRLYNLRPDEVICPNCGKTLHLQQRNIATTDNG